MSLFSRMSGKSRSEKLKLFYDTMRPDEAMTVLDIGAETDDSGVGGVQLLDSYPWQTKLCALNLSQDHVDRIAVRFPKISACVGDACNLPWPDKSFSLIYSNAVIEHVGDYGRQKKMASEIMRVGRSWFVTTPNRWFPFEFHMRLPFVTWLPFHGYLFAGQVLSFNHVTRRYRFFNLKREYLRLLTCREFQACFAGSRIIKQRVTFMPETLIAIGGDVLCKQGTSR